jgi:photosystem II stability/assembly factor-like uncharacterized protein
MARLARWALASAALSLSLAVPLEAREGVSATTVRVTIGPARLLSPSFGYAVGYRAVERSTTAETAIRLFLYGGGRWRDATPPMLRTDGINTIDDVAFVHRRDGWVAAYNCARARVYLYRTSDGGRSWRRLGEPTGHSCGGGPTYLSFVDERHGWMEPVSPNAPEGVLLETSDAGRSWHQVAAGPPTQVRGRALPCLAPIRFISLSSGWMSRCLLGGVFSTSDGGRSWRRATVAIPAPVAARLDLPWFSGSEGVIAATIGTRPPSEDGRTRWVAFSVTRDGGRTWMTRSKRRIDACPLDAYSTDFWPTDVVDRRVWWIVADGRRPAAQVTTDAGQAWRTSVARGLPSRRCSIMNVSAASARAAWVVAHEGNDNTALFQTVDAGRTWRQVTLFRR